MSKSKNTTGVDEENYIPIEEDKLKDDQRAELEKAIKMFRRECLKSSVLPDLVKWSRKLTSHLISR